MNYFNSVFTTFLGLERGNSVAVYMQGQKALGFHQNYLHLCSEDERRSYRFGTTWGWLIIERINIFVWTIPLRFEWLTCAHYLLVVSLMPLECNTLRLPLACSHLAGSFDWNELWYTGTTVCCHYSSVQGARSLYLCVQTEEYLELFSFAHFISCELAGKNTTICASV